MLFQNLTAKLIAAGVTTGLALTMGVNAWADKTPPSEQQLPLREIWQFTDVFGAVKNYYVDSVGDTKLLEKAMAGMVAGLDPHSAYLDAEAYKDLQESTEGEFGGLGIEVSKDGKNGVQVVSPIDDTPAAKAGIRAGDLIIRIDGKYTYGLSLSKCVKMMRGTPDTDITLQVMRKGEKKPLTFHLTRAIIKVQSIKFKELDDGFGYIRITQFQERTQADLVKALNSLEQSGHLKGLVLDLRNNPGGLLDAAVGVCSEFLPPNTLVVSTKGRNQEEERKYMTGEPLRGTSLAGESPKTARSVPIVVLINPSSASASEIVSGALQDHRRATIMGRRSFGKGSVQTIFPLSGARDASPTAIKLTTARYYTPSGLSIQAKGIHPDIEVDDTPEGNYPSFIIRESDLDNHLSVTDEKKEDQETDENMDPETAPKLTYKFGDEKDFPLQQAIRFLKHEPTEPTLRERQKNEKNAKSDTPAESKAASSEAEPKKAE